ncbi:hypothetical protein Asd1617_00630 [Shigella dysenteriae 1617]|uniref:Uncharacterized protein n=1 Tax=Shigella dysenteriae 1617 TaxID=754093 RepID=A0A0A6ZN93_SHIDY|nr:hypothetical protein Asd1617_00630 [Shigella dysenteriae 1617]
MFFSSLTLMRPVSRALNANFYTAGDAANLLI